eukprot:7566240-Pyramimonas_sp.AAC.1
MPAKAAQPAAPPIPLKAVDQLVEAAREGDIVSVNSLIATGLPGQGRRDPPLRSGSGRPSIDTHAYGRLHHSSIRYVRSMRVHDGHTHLIASLNCVVNWSLCGCSTEKLVDHSALLDMETSRGTALVAASSVGDTDGITLLLEYGANIHLETKTGMTALMAAVRESRLE